MGLIVRFRRVVASGLLLVLVGAGLVPSAGAVDEVTPEPVECVGAAVDATVAVEVAAQCGTEVEVTSLRTPWDTVFASPEGGSMGRPSRSQVEATLRGAGPRLLPGQNSSAFDHNGVRSIINWDMPWRSTSYFPET
jgi:hypothetical protein